MKCSKVDFSYVAFECNHLPIDDKSFWKPYFDILPDADLLPRWSDAELKELQDPELIREAVEYRDEVEAEWSLIHKLLKKYPATFPKGKVTKKMFMFAYANVVTRCFGWSLPCTMLIPVADLLNHAPIDAGNEMYNAELHEKAGKLEGKTDEKVQKYATKSKMQLDFSDLAKKPEVGQKAEEVKPMAIKPLVVEDDVITICTDMSTLNLKDKDYNIWNV